MSYTKKSSKVRSLPRAFALVIITLFVGLILWALIVGDPGSTTAARNETSSSDLDLYQAIASRVQQGEGYYQSAVSEQFVRNYPTSPASTVRLPTSAIIINLAGPKAAYGLLLVILCSVLAISIPTFEKISSNRLQWLTALMILASSLLFFGPDAVYFHETWAVLFLLLSIISREWNIKFAIGFALIACLFRELALPFLFAMGMYELYKNQLKNAVLWCLSGLGFLALYGLHIRAVSNALDAFGPNVQVESPSWLALGGWPFIVESVSSTTPLSVFPYWLSAIVVPLALLGWLLHRSDLALRLTFGVLVFVLLFLVLGRPNNIYWGFLYAPLLLPGLAFSLQSIRSLARDAFSARRKQSS